MKETTQSLKKLFVLDTNVLIHDPSSLFRFHEHDVYLPMVVLEELDHLKKGVSEIARNVRQVSRFLDELIKDTVYNDIEQGLPLTENNTNNILSGRLFFQTTSNNTTLPDILPGRTADNEILAVVLSLQKIDPERNIILVSKDINLRIKASILGIHSEDYYTDKTLSDVDLLYTGIIFLPEDFWESHAKKLEAWQVKDKTFYRIRGQEIKNWQVNQGLISAAEEEGPIFLVNDVKNDEAVIEIIKDYSTSRNKIWGINAKNDEQNLALNLLMNPEIDFITLLGLAGSGKTILALASGLAQVLDHKKYTEIIMTRVTVPVGEDIGFLPGTEEEKMQPWMGAFEIGRAHV